MRHSLTAGLLVAALVTAACGHTESRNAATAQNSHVPAKAVMAPGSCAEAFFRTIPDHLDGQAVTIARGAPVGVRLLAGHDLYVVAELRIEVLPPGTNFNQTPDQEDPLVADRLPTVLRLDRKGLAAADTDITMTFNGQDSTNTPLPAGKYPVVFYLKTTPAPGTSCSGSAVSKYGALGTLNWQG
jgi:hypothetical protein